jgi:hypothetical protein
MTIPVDLEELEVEIFVVILARLEKALGKVEAQQGRCRLSCESIARLIVIV